MPQAPTPPPPTAPAATIPAAAAADRPPSVRSAELFGAASTLRIEHKGAVYTLRATSKGGLLLTK